MPNTPSYYPPTIDGRAHWWPIITDNAQAVLAPLGYTPAQIAPILADAEWATYCYATVHRFFQGFSDALTAYETQILSAPNGTPMPTMPTVPDLPTPPASTILAGVEARRIFWVQEIKNKPGYNSSVGAQLGIETPERPFEREAYQCQLLNLVSNSPHTVGGRFRKAGGNVDGINLYGRKAGTAAWQNLGRFNATPFTAQVPLVGAAPENWEFYAMAVRADVEFGQGSAILSVTVRA